jgi:hypothetical protein
MWIPPLILGLVLLFTAFFSHWPIQWKGKYMMSLNGPRMSVLGRIVFGGFWLYISAWVGFGDKSPMWIVLFSVLILAVGGVAWRDLCNHRREMAKQVP